jgi:hypothetical protein
LNAVVRDHFPLLVSNRLCSSTAAGQNTLLASQVRHAKFFNKIGKDTWRLLMKHFIKWKIEKALTVDGGDPQRNRMWVTRPAKNTDHIATAKIVINKLKGGNEFVPWPDWLGDAGSSSLKNRANVSLLY